MRLCLFATSQRLVKYKLKGWFITKQNKAELHLSLYGWVCRVWMMDVKLLICSRFLTSLRRAQGQNWIRIFSKAQTTQRIECLILQNDHRKTALVFKQDSITDSKLLSPSLYHVSHHVTCVCVGFMRLSGAVRSCWWNLPVSVSWMFWPHTTTSSVESFTLQRCVSYGY